MRIDEEKLGEAVAAFEALGADPKAGTADAVWVVMNTYWGPHTAKEVAINGPDAVMATTVEEIYDLECYGWDEDPEAFVRLMIPLLYRAVSLTKREKQK